jgi:dolichol-phosphate mannosyltransferase
MEVGMSAALGGVPFDVTYAQPEFSLPAAASAVELAVVVPVYNEADNVLPLLAEIHVALAGRVAYEVIYVDDGSTDDTLDVLTRALRTDTRLTVIRHRVRSGQSAAVSTGVRAAHAPWIATLDGDGQNDPADIPRLLDLARRSPGTASRRMVAGYRRHRRDTRTKRWSSRLANVARQLALGDGTPDSGCGLKVFPREAFLRLPAFDHMHRFLPALFQAQGGTVEVAEVHHRQRFAGRSKYGTLDRMLVSVIDILGVVWLRRRSMRVDAEELT